CVPEGFVAAPLDWDRGARPVAGTQALAATLDTAALTTLAPAAGFALFTGIDNATFFFLTIKASRTQPASRLPVYGSAAGLKSLIVGWSPDRL
ncbi:MAG: hypothetical protein ACPIOQ_33165, partial [Promethearchaeia archaeon]